ncbi:MAG: ATP-binding protein [Methanoregula sp.]|jgi:PAS domain S-box-containing protein
MESKGPGKETSPIEMACRRIHLDRIFSLDPLRICFIYLVFGIVWIIFSDRIFLSLAARQEDIVMISSAKGVLFIAVTTFLLFLLIQHFSRQLREKNEQLRAQYEDLKFSQEKIQQREEELRVQYDALALSQAEWESTFNAISDWITLISPQGQILRSNRSVESLLGIPSGQVLGRNCFEFIHGTECHDSSCPRLRMLRSRKREIAEFPMRDGPGWLQVTVDPVTNSAGDIVSAVHIVSDITESMRSQNALEQAKKKLNLLNYVTFNDIQTMIFTLSGYQHLAKNKITEGSAQLIIEKEVAILQKISHSLKFAQGYQDLGLRPSKWQDANQVFLFAISHLDFLKIKHTVFLDNLEIFADPLLEQVFQILADNTLSHGKTATHVTLGYVQGPDSVTVFFEDDGIGIPVDTKDKIFLPDFQKQKGVGLFFAREILEITGITLTETGGPGKGARFEMVVPKGAYRFSKKNPV